MGDFLNSTYLYDHLPGFMREDDLSQALLLKRLLGFFGGELDRVDEAHDTFHLKIAPETAPQEFVEWWLWRLFGWGWFPTWFTLEQRREFYATVARHYARRGTKRGIEEFLAAFGITARVTNAPQYWGEFTVGEDGWLITAPLGLVVQIFPETAAVAEDQTFLGEYTVGEDHVAPALESVESVDVDELLRFQAPAGHIIVVEDKLATSA